MDILKIILDAVVCVAVLIGVVFLQKFLAKKQILLGLLLPLLTVLNAVVADVEVIPSIYKSYLNPQTIEKYENGLLVSKTMITTGINLPNVISVLAVFNLLPVFLLMIVYVERKKSKRKKELEKMKIDDLN